MLEYQTDVWAVLCEPPEQLHKLVNDLLVSPESKKKFNTTSFTWNIIDSDEVIRKFRIACVEYAMVAAGRIQPTPAPDYWLKVENSCQQVIDALNGTGDLAAVHAAASDAAWDAWIAATHASARAADAAAYAAAYGAAREDLFETLIQIIFAEYENRG